MVSLTVQRLAVVTGSEARQRCLRNDCLERNVEQADEIGEALDQPSARPLLAGERRKR